MACDRYRRDSGAAAYTGRANASGPIATIPLRPAERSTQRASQSTFKFPNSRPISARPSRSGPRRLRSRWKQSPTSIPSRATAHGPASWYEFAVDADRLFPGQALKEAEACIHHVIEHRGIGLLTGEPGCGKTSVLRRVAASLHPGRHKLVHVALTTGSVRDSCNLIGAELGCPPAASRYQAWTAIRTQVSSLITESRKQPILIVDEAHLLRTEVIEELRLLTNFETDADNRLCLLFAGLTTLRRRLTMTVFDSLTQRLAMQHHMASLGRDAHSTGYAGVEVAVSRTYP